MGELRFASATKYTIVGIANTTLYGVLLWLFLRYTALPHAISVAFAFLIAMLFQYSANRVFTFGSNAPVRTQLPKYFVTAALNYMFTVAAVWAALDIYGTSELMAGALASVGAAIIGYGLSVFWVYRS
jgi:putative flippase GtrA